MRRKTHPKTRKHTLCEPAQSKRFSTCQKRHHKIHFRRTNTLCQPAVETHVHMSEETSEKPRYTEIYRKKPRKKAAAQIGPRTQTNTLCEPAQSKRMSREIYR